MLIIVRDKESCYGVVLCDVVSTSVNLLTSMSKDWFHVIHLCLISDSVD